MMREDWEEILYKDAVNKISTTKQKLKQKEYSEFGEYPIVDQGQDKIGGYSNDKDRILDCKLPVVIFGDHTKCVKLINFKFIPGADGTKVLEPKPGIEPKYISTLTHVLVHKIKDKGYARHYQYIEKKNLPLAPLPEQRAIVAKIEELFSGLDQGIADLKKAQDQLEVYRQAVLKKAFEGVIVTKAKKDKLKNITSKIGSGSTPKGGRANYKTSGIPLVRSLNIHFNYIKYDGLAFIDKNQAEKLKNVIIQKDDILLNITGASIGRVNIAPKKFDNGRVNQHVSIIRPKDSSFNTKFLKFYLQSPKIQNWIGNVNVGATRQGLTKSALENLDVPILPLKQQNLIISEIESSLSVCDKVEKDIIESLEKAQALRQSILKKAFEGKLLSEEELAKCKAAPDYEPASVLLERIKKEKQKNKYGRIS